MNYVNELSLAELAQNPGRVLGNEAAASTLHFCSPAHGGWGVIRTALLIPEAYMLFVCPSACGRHGAIAAIEQGQRDRLAYLCLEDNEIALGTYQQEIIRGARRFIDRTAGKMKALMLFTSCIDDLLGSDHETAIRELERDYGIPVKHGRMNPITLSGKLPPPLGVQKTMYEFLTPPERKDSGVLLLGCFKSPARDSELARFIAACGAGPIRHPDFCGSFADFAALSQSAAGLVIRPEGKAAADHLATAAGIPTCPAFIAFDSATILQRYHDIAVFLHEKMGYGGGVFDPAAITSHFAPSLKAVETSGKQVRAMLGNAAIALDSSATCAPFGLALALVKQGFNVNRIYATHAPDFDKPAMIELARIKGGIIVANPAHAAQHGERPAPPLADIAVGFEAAYASAAPIAVPVAFDEARYGFEGYISVLKTISRHTKERSSLQDQVAAYGLVV